MNFRTGFEGGAIAVLLMLGCGGDVAVERAEVESETTGQETTTEVVQDTPAESADPATWADMNHDQRMAYMRETVMPEMKALFVEFDGERYADFGCGTCHGEDAREVGFEMPNGLAPLDPAHIPDIFQSERPMAVFMTQKAWPKMAELLDEPLFDPEVGEGFSCMNCHATAEGVAPH